MTSRPTTDVGTRFQQTNNYLATQPGARHRLPISRCTKSGAQHANVTAGRNSLHRFSRPSADGDALTFPSDSSVTFLGTFRSRQTVIEKKWPPVALKSYITCAQLRRNGTLSRVSRHGLVLTGGSRNQVEIQGEVQRAAEERSHQRAVS